jgi:DNA-binding NarL/FixJ family response regulator
MTLLRAVDPAAGTISVAVACDHRLTRAGLRALLEREAGLAVVGEAASTDDVVALTEGRRPDVVLLDVDLPGAPCVEVARHLHAKPGVAVMLLSSCDTDGRIFAALRAGASGVLHKDAAPSELIRAVRALGRGERVRPRAARRSLRMRQERSAQWS